MARLFNKALAEVKIKSGNFTEIPIKTDIRINYLSGSMNKPKCPRCDSHQVVKSGYDNNYKQNYKCHNCGTTFTKD